MRPLSEFTTIELDAPAMAFAVRQWGETELPRRFPDLTLEGFTAFVVTPNSEVAMARTIGPDRVLWNHMPETDETFDLIWEADQATQKLLRRIWTGATLVFDDPMYRGKDLKERTMTIRPVNQRIYFVSGHLATPSVAADLSRFCSLGFGGGGFACGVELDGGCQLRLKAEAFLHTAFDQTALVVCAPKTIVREASDSLGLCWSEA